MRIKKIIIPFFLLLTYMNVYNFSYAEEDRTFELVNIKKYATTHYKYKHKLPLFTVSIKNNSDSSITPYNLDCIVSFIDTSNKRIIDEYSRNLANDFKNIDPEYTSPLIDMEILSVDEGIIKIIGQEPIDFTIKSKIKCEFDKHVEEKELIFNPRDYESLPLWD